MGNKKEETVIQVVEQVKGTKKGNKKTLKKIADSGLIVMGAGFLGTIPLSTNVYGVLGHNFFEAGLVGGLADLFAVTALFRHPFNIKIPFTAILPRNRDKMTKAILTMVEKELLDKGSITKKLSQVNFTDKGLTYVDGYVKGEGFKDVLQGVLDKAKGYVEQVDTSKLELQILNKVKEKEQEFKTEKIISYIVGKVEEKDYDKDLLKKGIVILDKKSKDEEVQEKINNFVFKVIEKKAEESNGLLKMGLKSVLSLGKEKIASMVQNGIGDMLADLQREDSENRLNIEGYVREELLKLKTNEELIQTVEKSRKELLSDDFYKEHITKIMDEMKKIIVLKLGEEAVRQQLQNKIVSYVDALSKDAEKKQKIENKVQSVIVSIVDKNHAQIGKIIEEKLNGLSNEDLTKLIEEKVGNEMAGIRINGAICGGLIGLLLTGISMGVESLM